MSESRAPSTERHRRYSYSHAFQTNSRPPMVLPHRRCRVNQENTAPLRDAVSNSRYSSAATYNPKLTEVLKSNPRNMLYLRQHSARHKDESSMYQQTPLPSGREPRTFERIGTISEKDETDSIFGLERVDRLALDFMADDIHNRLQYMLGRHK